MTLGCGGYGGNITSDNISPRHLLNIKRLAYEVTPAVSSAERGAKHVVVRTPAGRAESAGISAEALASRIDAFLGSRGFVPSGGLQQSRPAQSSPSAPSAAAPPPQAEPPLDFVCEEDVRTAIQAGRTLVLAERAIVTPAARDLGERHRVFTVAPWRG
jgi:hypothetical protein